MTNHTTSTPFTTTVEPLAVIRASAPAEAFQGVLSLDRSPAEVAS